MAYFPNNDKTPLQAECARCALGELPCPVAYVQLRFNYNQVGNSDLREALSVLVSATGQCELLALAGSRLRRRRVSS